MLRKITLAAAGLALAAICAVAASPLSAQTNACATPAGNVTITAKNSWACLQQIDGKLGKLLAAPAPTPPIVVPPIPPVTPPTNPTPPPGPHSVPVVLQSPGDIVVPPFTAPRTIPVSMRLAQPVNKPVAWLCGPSNGNTYAPAYFPSVMTRIDFRVGETEKVIQVAVNHLAAGEYLYYSCGATLNHPPNAGVALFKIGAGPNPTPALPPNPHPTPVYVPARGTAGRTLTQDINFLGNISPTMQAGVLASQFDWGDWQSGNSERAAYSHATTQPGTTPHPIVNGVRVCRAEAIPTKTVAGGATVNLPFSACMVTTQNLKGIKNGYIEYRASMPVWIKGLTPAAWMMPKSGARHPELDIWERGLGGDPKLTSSIHAANGGADGLSLDLTPSTGYHTYGFDITDAWLITLIDGVEVVRRPNPAPGTEYYFIANIAVGGLAPDPVGWTPGGVLGEMHMQYLRFYE